MKLSESVWEVRLKSGESLRDRVKFTEPETRFINNEEFLEIWNRRKLEAKLSGNAEYITSSCEVVSFLESNRKHKIALLIWTEGRTGALFVPDNGKIWVME